MPRFFINRPIFAWVIAIVIALAGAIAVFNLPVEQYPTIAPPAVTVSASYPGASAQTVQDTVTQVIEQQMNGLDNLRYMSATSDSSGNAAITLTFNQGTNPDIAQVQVQNKVQSALALLPQVVQQQGLRVTKTTNTFLMIVGIVSHSPNVTGSDLADFGASTLQDPLSRVQGVGGVTLFGSPYAMRIWLDPTKLQALSLTPGDVEAAVRAQNAEVSAGQLGAPPFVNGQQLNATVTARSLLQTPEQFRNILLKTTSDGATVHLGDVARVEIGSLSYGFDVRFNGSPAAGMGIQLASGANAVDTSRRVKELVEQMRPNFPAGIEVNFPYDTTPFVQKSISKVVETLIEAVMLVFIVMFLFLQSWRATIIPTITVPVVLLGTFGVLSLFGYSINTLTMFACVLAIGLLVDDAIVVVENVERVMREERLDPKEATRKSMDQITGALIGVAMVLSAVFIPMAFFPGSTGVIYRQFSITIVSAMSLSILMAMTLIPALTSTLLRHEKPRRQGSLVGGIFNGFNKGLSGVNHAYLGTLRQTLTPKRRTSVLLVYGVIVALLALLSVRLPSSFFPQEDQGFFITIVQLPSGAAQSRTRAVMNQIEDYYRTHERDTIKSYFSVVGFGFAGTGQNQGLMFIQLKDWSERQAANRHVDAVVQRAFGALSQIKDGSVFPLQPPAVTALGIATGFDMELTNQSNMSREDFVAARNQLLGMAAQDPLLAQVRPNGQDDTPQLQLDIDQQAAAALGVSIADVNDTLAGAWGGVYINDFLDRGRIKHVYMQGDAPYRMTPENLDTWYVRNAAGEMTPFSAFTRAHWISAPPRLERFNGQPSFDIQGQGAPGVSSGPAMEEMTQLVHRLPPGVGQGWVGLSYEEQQSGAQAPALYALSLIVVFLCLAALYESWTIPLSVLLVVPLGLLGAVIAATLRGLSNDVYFQVGLLTTMGLASKNAILIVEFARNLSEQGRSMVDAALEAARIRMRPILMTSFAFISGVAPMALASGAGSGAQNAIGAAVVGGMVAATLLVTVLTPFFFVGVNAIFGHAWFKRRTPDDEEAAPNPGAAE